MNNATPYLSLLQVMERYGISRPTVYRYIQHRNMPAPIKFGRLSRWPLIELEAWESTLPRGLLGEHTELCPTPGV